MSEAGDWDDKKLGADPDHIRKTSDEDERIMAEAACPILKPGYGSKWSKAKCLKCPATAFIRVPIEDNEVVYICPGCAVTSKMKKDQD